MTEPNRGNLFDPWDEMQQARRASLRAQHEMGLYLNTEILRIMQMPEETFRDGAGVDVIAHRQDEHTLYILRKDFSVTIQENADAFRRHAAYVMIKVD